jgi:hypothetical protein
MSTIKKINTSYKILLKAIRESVADLLANIDGKYPRPLEIEDLTPSSARVESALWRKEQRAQEMGTITRVYDLDPYPARQPTRVEQQLIGKMFEDEEGRWIVRSVSYDHNMGRMVAYYERILTQEGVVVPAGEVEFSSWEEVYDWIVISAPKIHAKGAGSGARRSR